MLKQDKTKSSEQESSGDMTDLDYSSGIEFNVIKSGKRRPKLTPAEEKKLKEEMENALPGSTTPCEFYCPPGVEFNVIKSGKRRPK